MILGWQDSANLEQSLCDFLLEEITTDSLQVLDEFGKPKDIQVRVGKKFDTKWELPVISVYKNSESDPRAVIGSNRRADLHLIIIDIRANNETNRINLADWIFETINEGFPFYEYTMNGETPSRVQNGNASFDYVSNAPIVLGDEVSLFDKYRHRISINVWINKH